MSALCFTGSPLRFPISIPTQFRSLHLSAVHSMASIVLLLLLQLTAAAASAGASEADLLLTFKSSLSDPTSSLSTWSPTTRPCSSWTGISCSNTSSITSIDLHGRNLSGEISSSICELSHLSNLNLAHNSFNQPIPLHLSHCTRLLTLNLSANSLWGTLPDQLSLLSSLTALDLSANRLEGQVPLSIGSLKAIQVLNLGSNSFTGALHPALFTNLSELVLLDFSKIQSLTSELPAEIGKLGKLKWVFMQGSGFHGGIPESLLGLRELEVLDLSQNNLTGSIPLGFGRGIGKLASVDLSQNKLSGPFPADICYGKALAELILYGNSFTGSVPEAMGKCSSLERFEVQDNGFSGEFPAGMWSLPEIRLIRAENNRFSGELPQLAGVHSNLEQVQIDNNSFTATIPKGLGMINSMYRFSASLNGFIGNLPDDFCDSPIMSIINLSHNALSGAIPELRRCRKLVSLSLAGNNFTGGIPSSLARLPVLTYIDLSSNKLSGGIPPELQNLKLALLNVSFNQLSGMVPSSLISGLPASFLQGNPALCGPGLLNSCNERFKGKGSQTSGLIVALSATAFAAGIMVLAAGFFAIYQLSRRKSCSSSWKSVLFHPVKITEEELLMALEDKSAVGRGPFGNVYVVRLNGGEFVTVKRLLNSSNISFRKAKAEINTLAKARHKTLVKLLGFFYSEDVILLIHEYLQKGSLGDALCSSDFPLEWTTRLRIALGAAQALSYLHMDCIPDLLHRNMKSNNILLDADLEPKITGFGLDRIVGETSYRSLLTSEFGSSCYMASEHSCSKKGTKQMDVYSYGVVLLELISGRFAEKLDSQESLDVVMWIRRKINLTNGSFQVLDPKISSSNQQEMLGVLELALRCTSVMPDKRPTMPEVIRLLQSFHPNVHPPRIISCDSFISN